MSDGWTIRTEPSFMSLQYMYMSRAPNNENNMIEIKHYYAKPLAYTASATCCKELVVLTVW